MKVIFVVCAILGSHLSVYAEARFQVLHENKWHDVAFAKGAVPYILIDGKKVSARGDGMRLAQVGYNNDLMQRSPQWAHVDIISSTSNSVQMVDATMQSINNSLSLKFRVETVTPLNDVFAVIFLECKNGQKGYLVRSVGKLPAFYSETIDFSADLNEAMGDASYIFCLFANGAEVRQSLSKYSDFSYGMERGARERAIKEQTKQPSVYWSYPPRGLSKSLTKVSLQIEYLETGSIARAKVLSDVKEADRKIIEAAAARWWIVPKAEGRRTYPGQLRCEIDVSARAQWDSAAISLDIIEPVAEK